MKQIYNKYFFRLKKYRNDFSNCAKSKGKDVSHYSNGTEYVSTALNDP